MMVIFEQVIKMGVAECKCYASSAQVPRYLLYLSLVHASANANIFSVTIIIS